MFLKKKKQNTHTTEVTDTVFQILFCQCNLIAICYFLCELGMSHYFFSHYNDFIHATGRCMQCSRVCEILKGTFRFTVVSSGAPEVCLPYTKLSRKHSVTCLVSSGYVPYNNSGVPGVHFMFIFELLSQKSKSIL